jgi:hypothetical protein
MRFTNKILNGNFINFLNEFKNICDNEREDQIAEFKAEFLSEMQEKFFNKIKEFSKFIVNSQFIDINRSNQVD